MPDLGIQVQVVKSLSKTAVVVLNGSIDAKTVITFQTHLNSIKERGMNRFILDMEQVKYVNSTGLGYLINLSDSLGAEEGAVSLVKVQPKVKVVFDMLGLNAFFKIYPTRDEALHAFSLQETGTAPSEPTVVMDSLQVSHVKAPAGTAVVEHPSRDLEARPLECGSCRAILSVREPGTFKCPRCFALFNYSGNGKATFLPRRSGPPVQLSLNFEEACTEGLLEFVKRMAHKAGFSNGGIEEIQLAVRETVETLHRYAYGGNDHNVYHIQLVPGGSELELRFADYGISLSADRTDENGRRLFERVRGLVDRFDLRNHPKGGNFLVVSKTVRR